MANCSYPDCPNIAERSGKCATHARLERKAETLASQPVKERKQIAKVGTKNLFECSDGTKVRHAEINIRRSKAYVIQSIDLRPHSDVCHGCGNLAQAHAHIIPQARCKVIHKTELIWDTNNFFPACHECNLALENPKGHVWKSLKNIEKCLSFMAQHDPELFIKFRLYGALTDDRPTGEIKVLKEMFEKITQEQHKI